MLWNLWGALIILESERISLPTLTVPYCLSVPTAASHRWFGVWEHAGRVELFWECFYHQRCVLSIAAQRLQSPLGQR